MNAAGDRGRRLGLVLVVLLALLVHARALGGDFVFDDHRFVTDNARIAEIGDPARFFTDPWTQDPSRTPDIYRPLRTLVFALERAAFGLDPGPWHAVAILLHAAIAGLVYLLLIHLGLRAAAAAAGAAVFAVHPAQVEAVAWVSSLADLMAALFTLAGVHAWLRSRGPDRAYAAAVFAGLLACLSKEAALVYPGFLVLADLAKPGGGPAAVREGWSRYVLPVLVSLVFGLLVRSLLHDLRAGQVGHLGEWWGGSYGTNLAVAAEAAAYQALFAALPLVPSTDWYFAPATTLLAPLPLLCAAAVAAALAAAVRGVLRGGRDARLAGAAVILFALGGFMTSHLLFTVGIPRTDRFLYLSLAGAALLHGLLYERIAARRPRIAAALAAAGVLGMAGVSVDRIAAFRDDDVFFREATAGLPGPRAASRALAQRNVEGTSLLARAAEEAARGEEERARATAAGARAIFDEVAAGAAEHNARWKEVLGLEVDVRLESRALRNAALARLRAGDPAGALATLAKAEARDPGRARGLHIEAVALRALGRIGPAGWRMERAVAKRDPSLPPSEAADVLNDVAVRRASLGLDGAALRALRLSVSLLPDPRRNPAAARLPELEAKVAARRKQLREAAAAAPADVAALLAHVLYEGRGGTPEDARAAFEAAFRKTDTAGARVAWASATMESDDREEGWRAAESWYRETLARWPEDVGALLGLARCREALEDPVEAARIFREARAMPGASAEAKAEAEEGLKRLGK
jgi:hypothetical protein